MVSSNAAMGTSNANAIMDKMRTLMFLALRSQQLMYTGVVCESSASCSCVMRLSSRMRRILLATRRWAASGSGGWTRDLGIPKLSNNLNYQ